MKSAQDLLVEISNKIGLREGDTIVLTEHEPENSNDPNWIVAAFDYNARALEDMRKENPKVDWSDVEKHDGKRRILEGVKKS